MPTILVAFILLPGSIASLLFLDPPTDRTAIVLLVFGQLASFLAVVAGFLYQAWREKSRRKWLVEDRDNLERTIRQAKAEHSQLIAGLNKNTQLTQDAKNQASAAYSEANAVNRKIVALAEAGLLIAGAELKGDPRNESSTSSED